MRCSLLKEGVCFFSTQEAEGLSGRQSGQSEPSATSWLPSGAASTSAPGQQLPSSSGREKRLRLSGLPAEHGQIRQPDSNGFLGTTSSLMSSASGGFTQGVSERSGGLNTSRGLGFAPDEDVRWAGNNHDLDSGPPVPRSSFA